MKYRSGKKARLERAGYMHVSGWLPERWARLILLLIEDKRPEVEAAEKGEKE